jgi:competence protein ComEC
VSHGDNDHIGGSGALLAALPVTRVLTSVPERLPGSRECTTGQGWEWDGVRFDLLHPDASGTLRGNNRSCVLRVTSRYGRLLLPGDIAAPAERALLRAHTAELPAEVLVAPHHGSKSSSTEDFLDAVQPKWILLPVGYRNRYGHPHPEVLARYRARGSALADSATSGAITLRLDAAGLQVSHYRQEQGRYWHER